MGPGNGAAFARRFAAEGFAVALMARKTELIQELASTLPGARAYACDVGDASSVQRAFAGVRKDLGEVDVLVYNAGSGVCGHGRRGERGGLRDCRGGSTRSGRSSRRRR